MNQSLFALISRAGRMSLDELRARSSVETIALGREIVSMIREGVVTLSPNPEISQEETSPPMLAPADITIFREIQNLVDASQRRFITTDGNYDRVIKALTAALADDQAAYSVMVSPTSRGFKISA
jgi:hypothetical protein